MVEFSFVDLFCGAGGFTEGMLLSGDAERRFKLIAASDIHKHAQLTHENRFRNQLGLEYGFVCEDIRSQGFIPKLLKACKGQPVDLIVGGPPCQGFSVFGARRESDPRNDLFLHYLNAIVAIQPKYFVMENVPGLAMMYGGKTVDRIHEQVRRIREYEISGPITINAADYGVPQNRERILFIGSRRDMSRISELPSVKTTSVAVKDAIGDLSFLRPWESATDYDPAYSAGTAYQHESRVGRLIRVIKPSTSGAVLRNHEAAKHTPDVIARFSMIRQGEGFDSIPRELWDRHLSSAKKWCVKLDPNKPAFTVVTLPDDFVHYSQPRILTVREMARLQSFDDTFEFLGPRASGGGGKGNKKRNKELPQYSQVGNAVPPLMASGIGNALLRSLLEQTKSAHANALSSRLYRPIPERHWATA